MKHGWEGGSGMAIAIGILVALVIVGFPGIGALYLLEWALR